MPLRIAASTPAEWSAFLRAFRTEMGEPAPRHSLDLSPPSRTVPNSRSAAN